MNGWEKTFCRVYQAAFRIALPVLPYRSPKVYESVESLEEIMSDLQPSAALLVTDRGVVSAGLSARVEEKLAVAAGVAEDNMPEAEAAAHFIAAIRKLNAAMGIPTGLKGIRREDIPMMARHAAKEANPLYPVPVLWSAQELERLYEAVMEEGESA